MNIVYEDGKLVRYRGNMSGLEYEIEKIKTNGKTKIIIDSNLLNNPNYLSAFGKVLFNSLDDFKKIGTRYSDASFEFRINNDNDLVKIKEIVNKYPTIKSKCNVINNSKSNNLDNNMEEKKEKKTIENYIRAKLITVNNNGKLTNRIVRAKDSERGEYVLDNVNMDDLQREFDLLVNSDLSLLSLSEEEITNKVIDSLEMKRKRYDLESRDKVTSIDGKGDAIMKAAGMDSKINTELGMAMNDPGERNDNSFKTVESNGDNYNVVNPSVSEVYGNNVTMEANSSISSDVSSDEVEERGEEVYYLDSYSGEVYNKDGEKIGMIGNEFSIDSNDNYLVQESDGKKIRLGPIDDINNLGKSNDMNGPKVRRRVKPSDLDNAAFVNMNSFIVLITIFSVMAIFLYLISK